MTVMIPAGDPGSTAMMIRWCSMFTSTATMRQAARRVRMPVPAGARVYPGARIQGGVEWGVE